MNPDETTESGVSKDTLPSGSQILNSDNNANLRVMTDESKGAIPKTKSTKVVLKKSNNNIGELVGMVTRDPVKVNGFGKKGSTSSNNYLSNNGVGCSSVNTQVLKQGGSGKVDSMFERNSLNILIDDEFLHENYAINKCSELDSRTDFNDHNDKSDSSSDDNELLSISDDGCIYTYKGDQVADLPSSFYNLEIPPLNEVIGDRREGNSSPEMDFLEMDFDPGPSGDPESDSISNSEIETAANLPLDTKPDENDKPETCHVKDCPIDDSVTESNNLIKNDISKISNLSKPIPEATKVGVNSVKTEVKMPWSCSLSERTRAAKTLRVIKRHHNSKGELSPNDTVNGDTNITNLSSFHNATSKILIEHKTSIADDTESAMIWSHHEACLKQITQIGPSACGATAVLNVLNALRVSIPTSLERIQESVHLKLRANSSPLPEYLLSRSFAGCTHRDLISSLYTLSDKRIYSRFFAMYPERLVNLRLWLSYWIRKGAVPIATLNLQKCEGSIPDSWHHQMIFGVGPEGIYLTNPLECVDPDQLWPQLSSESVLLVRTEDVLVRWNSKKDLSELMKFSDVRWSDLNVIGQIARIIRENRRECKSTTHIRIPAAYKSGITLAVDIGSPAFAMLRHCPELPLLHPSSASAL